MTWKQYLQGITETKRNLIVFVSAGVIVATLVVVLQSSTVDLHAGLAVLLTFPESYSGGEIRELSSVGSSVEVVGEPARLKPASNSSVQFSGNEDSGFLRVHLDEAINEEFSIVVRVSNPQHSYHAGIVTSKNWRLITTSERYEFVVNGSSVRKRVNVDSSQWHHVTVTYSDGAATLFVDGRKVDQAVTSGNVSTKTILIGRRPSGYVFDGRIDEVRIYNRALPAPQVRGLYAKRDVIIPIVYSDGFRIGATFTLVLMAFGGAVFEQRIE